MSSYGYSNPNQSSVPASQQNVARVIPPEPTGFTGPPGSTAPPGGTFPPRPPIDPFIPNVKLFAVKDSAGNPIIYKRGDVVLYKGESYEVLSTTLGFPPDMDRKNFKKIVESVDISIIDGGEF